MRLNAFFVSLLLARFFRLISLHFNIRTSSISVDLFEPTIENSTIGTISDLLCP